jgi:fatty-acyl-CoA synthase
MRFDPVATHASMSPDRLAVADLGDGRRFDWAALDAAIDRLAAWLVSELAANSGARVATLSKNCAEMVVLQYASVRAGCIFVPLNWRLAEAEIAALAHDAGLAIAFVQPGFAEPPAGRVVPIAAMFELGAPGDCPPADARRGFEDVSCLLYTSGTSGRPKGVMLSERNVAWGATNFILSNGVGPDSVFLCDMPLFHTAGLHAACRTPIQAGATVLVTPGFDPVLTLERLSDPALGVTHYFSVPQMAATLWNRPEFDAARLRHLRVWAIGGAPNPRAQSERFVRAGIRIAEGFGMSETNSNFGMPAHRPEVLLDKAGSCGLPFVAVEARIVDEAGRDVPVGERGELLIRGPSVAQGYWNQPELTAKAFRDGWFATGDTAMRDADGFHYIVDRLKDMYISGGENVYPAEIEAVLAELPEVAEAALVGVPDARWGEVGRVYVIPVAGRSLTAEQIVAHCAARLARFKVPATAVVTDAIPRTASGKVQKHLLRARALSEIGG